MSSEWAEVRLEDVTSVLGDGLHGTPEYDDQGDYYFINGNNLNDGRIIFNENTRRTSASEFEKYKKNLNSRTILVSINGTLGNVALYRGEQVVLGKSACYFNVREDVDKQFVRYVVASDLFQNYIHNLATGSTIKNVSLKLMRDFRFMLPSLELQEKISAVLVALDDRIALLRASNATLEAIAQAMFKSWFVDFDPVHAKQQGRAPEGMSEATAALFPDSFEESELGLVPRGWGINKIGDISEILNGFAFKSGDYVNEESGVFLLRTTNFSNDGYATRLDKDVFVPESFKKSYSKFLCQPFDFHLVMVGASVGTTSTLLPHMLPALRNQNMWCFRPREEFPSKFFIHETVKLKVVDALRSTSGSAREFLRKGDFEKSKLSLPNHELLIHFEDTVRAIKNRIAVNENMAMLLGNISETLLPRLISGQLRLPDVKIDKVKIEEVA